MKMLKNNFKIAWRKINRNKVTTFVNILGLTIGLTACLLIGLLVEHEWNYDDYHQKAAQIYRVNYWMDEDGQRDFYNVNPNALANAIKAEVPGIVLAVQLQKSYGKATIKVGDTFFKKGNICFVKPDYFDLFDYRLLKGNDKEYFDKPNKVILTEQLAHQFFGEKNPIGQLIDLGRYKGVEVVGIIANLPTNTHLPFQIFGSFVTRKNPLTEWEFSDGNLTYLELKKGQNPAQIEQEINHILKQHQAKELLGQTGLQLQALNDIHTNAQFSAYGDRFVMDKASLWGLLAIGLFILFSAVVNFINQSTALSWTRGKEIGVRKVLGSNKKQIIFQFLSETYLQIIVASGLAIALTSWLLPIFNTTFGLIIPESYLYQMNTFFWIVIGMVLLGLLAGIYPAFLLAQKRPVLALKGMAGNAKNAGKGTRFSLTTFQLVTTQLLMIGAIVVYQQMDFIQTKNLGFQSTGRVIIDVSDDPNQRNSFKNNLAQIPAVQGVTYAMGGPTKSGSLNNRVALKDKTTADFPARVIPIDANYLEVFDLTLVAGNQLPIEQENLAKATKALVNESMAKQLGFATVSNILGQLIQMDTFDLQIVGVVKDFHQKSLHSPIAPSILLHWPRWTHKAGLEIQTTDWSTTIGELESVYQSSFPNRPFSYTFFDGYLAELYTKERQIFSMLNIFTSIALFIACLGLFAMISITTNQRRKEIGIRKVLGANVENIIGLLSKDFFQLVILALFIAAPIGYYFAQKWLMGFAYRININIWVFFIVGSISLLITGLTVSFQSVSAALANPVKSLKNE